MNDLSIILLPVLPSVVVGVAAIVGFTLYGREKLKLDSERGQHNSLRQQFSEADDAHVETMKERDEARAQRDKLNAENGKLHAQEKLLIDAMNKHQEEKGKVDEAPEITMETNTLQNSTKPVRAKRRTTPSSD